MGGAQPLAASFAGFCSLNIECQQSRIDFRLRSRYLDEQANDLDDALARIKRYTAEGKAVSIGLLGNAARILPALAEVCMAVPPSGPISSPTRLRRTTCSMATCRPDGAWSSGVSPQPIQPDTLSCATLRPMAVRRT